MCPATPCPAMPCHALPCHALPCPAMLHLAWIRRVVSCHTLPIRVLPWDRRWVHHLISALPPPCAAAPCHVPNATQCRVIAVRFRFAHRLLAGGTPDTRRPRRRRARRSTRCRFFVVGRLGASLDYLCQRHCRCRRHHARTAPRTRAGRCSMSARRTPRTRRTRSAGPWSSAGGGTRGSSRRQRPPPARPRRRRLRPRGAKRAPWRPAAVTAPSAAVSAGRLAPWPGSGGAACVVRAGPASGCGESWARVRRVSHEQGEVGRTSRVCPGPHGRRRSRASASCRWSSATVLLPWPCLPGPADRCSRAAAQGCTCRLGTPRGAVGLPAVGRG